jgi:ribosomal-protein-alanine N-acetyltransferase
MIAPENFETPRLLLRPPRLEDAEAIFDGYAQDPAVSKYVVWKPHKAVAETRDFLRYCAEQRRAGRIFSYVILAKDGGRLIGMVELGADGVLGYVLARAYWGRGYMTEAVQAVVGWAMGQDEIRTIQATCDVDNPASARVMEKAGLKFEGLLPRHSLHPNVGSEPRDALSYSIIK